MTKPRKIYILYYSEPRGGDGTYPRRINGQKRLVASDMYQAIDVFREHHPEAEVHNVVHHGEIDYESGTGE